MHLVLFERIKILQNLIKMTVKKQKILISLIILIFFIIGSAIIIVNPIFEGPDASAHFAYILFVIKNHKIPKFIEWREDTENYIKENLPEKVGKNYLFIIDNQYAFAYAGTATMSYNSLAHNPITYYALSAIIIGKLIDMKTYENLHVNKGEGYNSYYYLENSDGTIFPIDSRIFYSNSKIFYPVYLLKFIQLIFGMLIVFFIFRILKLLLKENFNQYTIILASGICLLPALIFLSTHTNNSVLSILFSLISVYFLIILSENYNLKSGIFAIIFAFLSFITKFYNISILVVSIIFFLYWLLRQKKRKIFAVFIATFIFLFAVFLITFYFKGGETFKYFMKYAFISKITDSFIYFTKLFSKEYFLEYIPKLAITSIASFDINHVIADKFVYYFYYSYIFIGIILFTINLKKMRNKLSTFIIIYSIIIITFVVLSLYAASKSFTGWGGRLVMPAFILTFILSIIGYNNIDNKLSKFLFPSIFIYIILVNLFNIYQYIYLFFYKNITINFILY